LGLRFGVSFRSRQSSGIRDPSQAFPEIETGHVTNQTNQIGVKSTRETMKMVKIDFAARGFFGVNGAGNEAGSIDMNPEALAPVPHAEGDSI